MTFFLSRGHKTRKSMKQPQSQPEPEREPTREELENEFRLDDAGKPLNFENKIIISM